jgi:hypothetical protein
VTRVADALATLPYRHPGPACSVCAALDTLTPEERAEYVSYYGSAPDWKLCKVLGSLSGMRVAESTVGEHRRRGHDPR